MKNLNALLFRALLFAVSIAPMAALFGQLETLGDPFLPTDFSKRKTSPPFFLQKKLGALTFTAHQANVDASGQNILGDAANEPSLAVSPVDPMKMAIGWRQFDDVQNNFRQAGFAYSNDGGATWINPGVVIEPGIFHSDPVLAADADGLFYYNTLKIEPDYHCLVHRSTGDGTWDAGVEALGGDKQWMDIDRTDGPGRGTIYSNWSSAYSTCPPGNFTRSTDGGDSYPDCAATEPDLFWGTVNVGPSGEIYIVGANGEVAKSQNASDATQPIVWEMLPMLDFGGIPNSFTTDSPNPGGLLGQIWTATNHAAGPLLGQVYALASVGDPSQTDPMNIHFVRSSDGGQSWSAPVRINDDDPAEDNWQWFGTMSVAPTGRIDVVWLDARDWSGTYLSSLYYSNLFDGGATWSPNARLSEEFDPHIGWPQQQKMGDYFHMVSDAAGADLAWAGTFNGEQDVYFGRIDLGVSATKSPENAAFLSLEAVPNPFSEGVALTVFSDEKGPTRLLIFDQMGKKVRALEGAEKGSTGHGDIFWDGKNDAGQPLPSGIYTAQIFGKDGSAARKLVLIR